MDYIGTTNTKSYNSYLRLLDDIADNKFSNYSFTNSKYINNSTSMLVFCEYHGEFTITVASLRSNKGCRACGIIKAAKTRRKVESTYIEELKAGGTGVLLIGEYLGALHRTQHKCPCGVIWKVRPHDILRGQHCYKCKVEKIRKANQDNPTGWAYSTWEMAGNRSKNFDAFKVYIIRCFNIDEEFFKIGKTYVPLSKRFSSNYELPYAYDILKIISGGARAMSELETNLQNINKDNRYEPKVPFKGMYECFTNVWLGDVCYE